MTRDGSAAYMVVVSRIAASTCRFLALSCTSYVTAPGAIFIINDGLCSHAPKARSNNHPCLPDGFTISPNYRMTGDSSEPRLPKSLCINAIHLALLLGFSTLGPVQSHKDA